MSILLNSNITTTLNPNVIKAMEPFNGKAIDFNAPTKESKTALKAYKEAIDQIYLGLKAGNEDTIVLNSGANEGASQVFLSTYMQYILTGRKNSIILSQRAPLHELKLARFLESQGCRVYRIEPNSDGVIDIEVLKSYINEKTALVSVPMVDEETGVVQPIEEIGDICNLNGAPLYVDASSAFGNIEIDLSNIIVSYLSVDAYKIHGPKDIGALYINKNAPELMPTTFGDNAQNGLRAQIKNIANVIGFGRAAQDAIDALDYDVEDMAELRDMLEQELLKIEGAHSLSPWALRVPNCAILAFENIHASILLNALAHKDIAAYSFMVQNGGNFERISAVEVAGLDSSLKHCAIGFWLSIYNTQEEINQAIATIKETINQLRENSFDCKESK